MGKLLARVGSNLFQFFRCSIAFEFIGAPTNDSYVVLDVTLRWIKSIYRWAIISSTYSFS